MSKTKIGGKKLIIQFGREETLFALWDKGPSFSHTLSLPTPAGAVEDGDILNVDAIRDLLNTALGTPELKNVRNVVFALCTSQVISETISVPEMSNKKLDKLIHANVDMYFPVDMTDYRLVWQTIGPKTGPGGMKEQSVQLWAVPNAMLAPYYAIANECGLSVSAIDYCGNSIATAVGASFSTKKKSRPKIDLKAEISFGRKKAAEPVEELNAVSQPIAAVTDLHVTLDNELIGITFVQNGLVVHQRFVRCGSNPAYQFDEVAMMVEYFRSLEIGRSSEFSAVVSGALAEDSALVEDLSFALDMPLPVFSSDVDPRWIVCAGAARTALDFGNSELNNPVRSVSPKANQLAQTAVLTAGGAALAGVVALTFVARFSWNATIDSLEAKRQNLAIQLQKVAGYADKYNEYSTLYDNYSSDWNVVFNNLRTYNDNLVRLLEELEDILPRKASVTAMKINADGLDVQFACDKKEDAAYLIMALRELQYADLTAISSLSGGGRGPANTYGNGEKAPTEGSDWLTIEQRDNLANLLSDDFGPAAIVYAFNSPSDAVYIQGIESHFRSMPSTDIVWDDDGNPETPEVTFTCGTLADLENIYTNVLTSGDSITFAMRKNAINALMTANPISFARMLSQINNAGQSGFFYWDMALAYTSLKYDSIENTAASMQAVADILTTNEQYVSEAEKLIVGNGTLQKWYIYYLREQINNRLDPDITPEEPVENPLPSPVYVDMEKIINDLLDNASFDTDDRKLNVALYGLLSDQTLDMIDNLIAAKPTPTPTPTPPPTPTLNPTEALQDAKIKNYLTTGTSEDTTMNQWLDAYITTGDAGDESATQRLKDYFSKPYAEDVMKELIGNYLQGGNIQNKVLNSKLYDYFEYGTSEHAIMDDFYNRSMDLFAKGAWPEYESIKPLLEQHDKTNNSDDKRLNKLIKRLDLHGSTGSKYLDEMIARYHAEAEEQPTPPVETPTSPTVMPPTTSPSTPPSGNPTDPTPTVTPEWTIPQRIEGYIKDWNAGDDDFGKNLKEQVDQYISNPHDDTNQTHLYIKSQLEPGDYDEISKEVVAEYLEDGDIKNDVLEKAIKLFLDTGTSNNTTVDDLLKRVINEYAKDTWPKYAEFKLLMDTFQASRETSGDTRLDKLLMRYKVVRSTGSTHLDSFITTYLNDILKNGDKEQVQNAVNNAVKDSSGSSGTPTDTRVSFTVSLGYNDELKRAELERKGLSDDSMIAKQEVNG